MQKVFDNEERRRFYGVRRGDTIEYAPFSSPKRTGEVVKYGWLDNNAVYVLFEGEKEPEICVAEWCHIIIPVEEKPHSVCVILRKEELILGVSRKYDPNDMGLPGGKVDPGETPDQAIVREVKEETGLDITNLEEFFTRYYGGYIAHCYTADYSGEISKDDEKEKGRVDWVTQEELLNGCFGEYNRDSFEVLGILIK